jgi:hypothetical protein
MSEVKTVGSDPADWDSDLVIHILRNPYGWHENDIRRARLAAADALEAFTTPPTTSSEI